MDTYMLRVEDLRPICPDLFEADELVYVVNGGVLIADLKEAAARLRETGEVRH